MRRRPFLKTLVAGAASALWAPRQVESQVLLTLGAPGAPAPADWQLDSEHYTPAKVAWPGTAYASQVAADTEGLTVYPRPDTETDQGGSPWARHRWAHPSMIYEIPVCVRGGAFPYHMEIDTTNTDSALTATATVGANHDSTNSWVVRIPAATINGLSTSTDYDVYVKVTDQESNELKVWWSFQKEATELDHFFFVDTSYTGGTKDGKEATPFDSIAQAGWLASGNAASSAKKILAIKEGNSQVTPITKNIDWEPTATAFPCAIINIPDETPKLDLNDTAPIISAPDIDDIFIWGLEAINGFQPVLDGEGSHIGLAGQSHDRWTIGNCIFDEVAGWSTAGINSGVISGAGAFSLRTYLAIVNMTIRNTPARPSGGNVNEGSCATIMSHKWVLLDNWTCSNIGDTGKGGVSPVSAVVFFKHNNSDWTCRRITAYDQINAGNGNTQYGGLLTSTNPGAYTHYNYANCEIHHNNVGLETTGYSGIAWPGATGVNAEGPCWMHRNTIYYDTANSNNESVLIYTDIKDLSPDATVEILDNVSNETSDYRCFATCTGLITETGNKWEVGDSNFNSDHTLTNAYLTAQGLSRGEIGHEIA